MNRVMIPFVFSLVWIFFFPFWFIRRIQPSGLLGSVILFSHLFFFISTETSTLIVLLDTLMAHVALSLFCIEKALDDP